ncbi:MAG TPA: response regulator [Polyangiaceae bacterium]|nr:response regulator [Polyangiaceae bacterium]
MTTSSRSMVSPRPPRVLIVDDDPDVVSALVRLLRAAEPDWETRTARDGQEALACFERESFDVVMTDLQMPSMDGFQLLRRLARSHPETIRIVHSSHGAMLGTELVRYLAHNVVAKPSPSGEVLSLLRWAVRAAGSVERNASRA